MHVGFSVAYPGYFDGQNKMAESRYECKKTGDAILNLQLVWKVRKENNSKLSDLK